MRARKSKKYGKSKPPEPLTTNWLQDDYYETSSHKPYSYAKAMARYYVIHKETGVILHEFKEKHKAVSYARGRNSWVHSFEPSEEAAHELRLKEKAEQRWEAGYGA